MKGKLLLPLLSFLIFICGISSAANAEGEYRDYVVYIDPGHGGYDGGAKTKDGIFEKEINLNVSLYLRNYLEKVGIQVLLTRAADVDYSDYPVGTKKRADLEKRIDMINDSNADLFVSIHMNALPDARWRGAQTFYYSNFDENKILAGCLQSNLRDVLKNTERLPRPVDSLYLFKMVKKPGALVEGGFLSNPEEAALLNTSAYQQKIAFGIYLGILDFLDTKENIPFF